MDIYAGSVVRVYKMGMFDTIDVLYDSGIVCAGGHEQQVGLQTKDLDCALDRYFLQSKNLYKVIKEQRYEDRERSCVIWTAKKLEVERVYTEAAVRVRYNGSLVAYGFCPVCVPIVVSRPGWHQDCVKKMQPLNTWELVFRASRLKTIRPVKNPTRQEFKEYLKSEAYEVLDDSDPVVKKMLQKGG